MSFIVSSFEIKLHSYPIILFLYAKSLYLLKRTERKKQTNKSVARTTSCLEQYFKVFYESYWKSVGSIFV